MNINKLLIILILLSAYILPQQKYYTFSGLEGLKDTTGNIHLFYRLYYSYNSQNVYEVENSIYHLDLSDSSDTLFLFDGGGYTGIGDPSYTSIINFKFWNNDPEEYIYSGVQTVVDPVSFIQQSDEDNPSITSLGEARNGNIEISKQNDSLIFACLSGNIIKSSNGGRTWDTVSNGKELISLCPYNDNILFAQEGTQLVKSIDGGKNFSKVDTFSTNYKYFLYDKDSLHIYRIANSDNENYLLVSNNKGDAYSWEKRFSSVQKILISIDPFNSGIIYLAAGSTIYYSTDYGASFNLYRTLERKIVGLYASAEDTIYVATEYDLYLLIRTLARTPDIIKTIKHLAVNPDVFSLYPLKVGNEWTYEKNVEMYKSRYKIKVIKDTIIEGKQYFKMTNGYFRIDTSYGKVYEYISGDVVSFDFSAIELDDTVFFNQGGYEEGWFLENKSEFNLWGINSERYVYTYIIPTSGYRINTFVKDIGLYRDEGGELLASYSVLIGFIKDGVVYGDTTVVGIDEGKSNKPVEYSLFQNYPNPFNPSTIIQYSIPKTSFVTLKIFNILGKEIATLVNEEKPAGNYQIEFNIQKTINNKPLSSGIYFYKLHAGDYIRTKKMIYLK